MRRPFPLLTLLLGAAWLLAGCSTTRVTSQWVDESRVRPLDSVMVIGVTEDEHSRRIYEDSFRDALAGEGLAVSQGYRELGEAVGPEPDPILERISGAGVDALLVTHVLGVDNKTVFHPPTVSAVPNRYYDHFSGYYRTVYSYVHMPGYTSQHVIVRLETNLYDAATQELLWSAQSESVDPETIETVIGELAPKVTAALRKLGFIAP